MRRKCTEKVCCEPYPLSLKEGEEGPTLYSKPNGCLHGLPVRVEGRVSWSLGATQKFRRREKDQGTAKLCRLAEMVFWYALRCQSLPSNGKSGYGFWERNRCIPKHPSGVLSNRATSEDKETPAAEGGCSVSGIREPR